MNENNELAPPEWAITKPPDPEAKFPVKDEAELLNHIERRLAYIWHLNRQIDIQRKAMNDQVLFVKAHYEGKIAQIESTIQFLSGAPIAALKEIQIKEPKRKSLSVPHGRVQARTPADKIVWGNEAEVIADLKEQGVAWAIRVKEDLDKRALASHKTVIDGKVYVPITPDAECEDLIELKGVRVEPQDTSYSVELIGGKK